MKILISRLIQHLHRRQIDDPPISDVLENSHAVNQARIDWINAKGYFDQVIDPDLIEQAAYVVKATEKRYMYLLKQSKKRMVSADRVDGVRETYRL